MDKLASIVEYYLPVFIPVFLTIISVLAGVVTKRIRLTLGDLFKIHSDLVLGLFSFVIWALVAYQQTGRIDLNANSGISLIRVVLLLFGNVTLLIAGLIVLSIKWHDWVGPEPRWSAKHWENAANGGFLLLTFIGVFAPIGLAKDRPKPVPAAQSVVAPQTYLVAIPYSDSSIPKQLGTGRWANRLLCDVTDVSARSVKEAREVALKNFDEGGRKQPTFAIPRQTSSVVVAQDRIVAERREQ